MNKYDRRCDHNARGSGTGSNVNRVTTEKRSPPLALFASPAQTVARSKVEDSAASKALLGAITGTPNIQSISGNTAVSAASVDVKTVINVAMTRLWQVMMVHF